MTRGLSPAAIYQTYPAEKKEEILKRSSSLSQQLFSAAILSSSSQQPCSAAILSNFSQQLFSAAILSSLSQQPFSSAIRSSHSQRPFSAAILSSHSQQPFTAAILQLFSAAILSSHSQQPFSAAIRSSHSQQLFSTAILRSHSQQLFSAAFLSSHSQQPCGQGLVVSYYHHLAVVRGWWSAIIIILSSSCCGQGLVVSYYHHLVIILLWPGVGGQLCTRSLEGPFRNAFGKNFKRQTTKANKQTKALPNKTLATANAIAAWTTGVAIATGWCELVPTWYLSPEYYHHHGKWGGHSIAPSKSDGSLYHQEPIFQAAAGLLDRGPST